MNECMHRNRNERDDDESNAENNSTENSIYFIGETIKFELTPALWNYSEM